MDLIQAKVSSGIAILGMDAIQNYMHVLFKTNDFYDLIILLAIG